MYVLGSIISTASIFLGAIEQSGVFLINGVLTAILILAASYLA
jgi:hypothetical protein